MSLNSLQLQGNLVRDPELRYSKNGTAVCEFTLAVSDGWGDDKNTFFFDCKAFGKTAETIAKFRKKGDEVLIGGRLSQDSWEVKSSGKKRTKDYPIAERFHFTNGKRSEKAEASTAEAQPPTDTSTAETDSVPF